MKLTPMMIVYLLIAAPCVAGGIAFGNWAGAFFVWTLLATFCTLFAFLGVLEEKDSIEALYEIFCHDVVESMKEYEKQRSTNEGEES